jgi:DNA-binding response OmpR family regulator
MRILLVEDEHKIANALKKGLEQEGYAVDAVYDGDDGYSWATADNGEYDLVILDWMLPGEYDGLGILNAMRTSKNHTPVIFLTAKDQVRDRVTALNAGADDYLVKPFAFEELLARTRSLLRRPQGELAPTISCDDLSLDPVKMLVTRSGRQIELSAKEFSLLEYMMRNKGRILSKDNIISHVWDFDADVLPNTVEVYIGYLRKKIDGPNDKKLINTKRGFGYYIGERI